MDNLRQKISCKVILIHDINTSDGLTNGQLGTLIDVIRANAGRVTELMIEFKNKNVGKQIRERSPKIEINCRIK